MGNNFIIDGKIIFFSESNRLVFVERENFILTLGQNESRLLFKLLKDSGKVLKRKELIDFVWNNYFVDDTSLNQSISILRRALNDSIKMPLHIKTVPKVGYKFISEVKKYDYKLNPLQKNHAENKCLEDFGVTIGNDKPHFEVYYSSIINMSIIFGFLFFIVLFKGFFIKLIYQYLLPALL
ncbi:winged helix-turn-helix domain-containing protein [Vibrio alginolyticus]|nr:winged helix-turn-helix domain-containing protein [Vibrio alginolyticus]EMD1213671.1 winged helix-turn-helix domain-containing protein [Vibrio alginolyticus]